MKVNVTEVGSWSCTVWRTSRDETFPPMRLLIHICYTKTWLGWKSLTSTVVFRSPFARCMAISRSWDISLTYSGGETGDTDQIGRRLETCSTNCSHNILHKHPLGCSDNVANWHSNGRASKAQHTSSTFLLCDIKYCDCKTNAVK
jgi:hypothetical protein